MEQQLANSIRMLSVDAVQKANSGHPGMPMGMADIATVLWRKFLRHNPNNPNWHNRDRFVLSNGHGSMLLYSLLHLTGYDVSIDDLKSFRQLHSKTPGHPEYGYTPGIETTTGPLGQGISNAVGMAIAEKTLAATFNRDGLNVIDHYTYVFMGDGCLMEGVSHESCSLAGTLGLGKLIVFWDDNGISIDGKVEGWFTDNTAERFKAYGWQVIESVDGHDANAVEAAIGQAQQDQRRPTLICCRTVIGFGSPNKAGTAGCHGAALGESEVEQVRQQLGWSYAPFEIPSEIYQQWDAKPAGQQYESDWQLCWQKYQQQHPALSAELTRRLSGQLPEQWSQVMSQLLVEWVNEPKAVATRKASQMVLERIAKVAPELLGGSADLTGSNNTNWSGSVALTPENSKANYIYYGVREFGMAAIMNGMAIHGGFIPYGGTFLVFSDYARNALRMAALMKQRAIYVFTHDSIGLGEDGPTHQPVEHLASLRIIPNMSLWRPADAVESAVAWQAAVSRQDGPTSLIFSRQTLPAVVKSEHQLADVAKGGYVLTDCSGQPDVILLATGSEVGLALSAAEALVKEGRQVRVVSMPSVDTFEAQDQGYRSMVLPADVPVVVIEAGVPDAWYRYTGNQGQVIGMTTFGESAPASDLFEHFGFTVDHVVKVVKQTLAPANV